MAVPAHLSFPLRPLAAVERASSVLDAATWRSMSNDPQLELVGELPWKPGTELLFEVDVMAIEGGGGPPMLYFDFGHGYEAANGITLARCALSSRAYSAVVRLAAAPRRIRFDPCWEPGEVFCSEVRVVALPPGRAAQAGVPVSVFPGGAPLVAPPPPLAAASVASAPRIAAVLHLFHEELWAEAADYIARIPTLERLYVSISRDASGGVEERIARQFPQALVRRVPNRGRDALPFLQWLEVADAHGIELVCKLHTKRSTRVAAADAWRRDLLDKLLGSSAAVLNAVCAFEADANLGMLAPGGHMVRSSYDWEGNAARVVALCARMGRNPPDQPFEYVSGSMFWARLAAFAPLRRLMLRDEDFEPESGATEGTLRAALERCYAVSAILAGMRIGETANPQRTRVHDFAPPPPRPRTYETWIEEFELPRERYRELAAARAAWSDAARISLLMPTYETPAEHLRAALDSVLAQAYPNWELCVADDASRAPHVAEILEEYRRLDARIKVIYRPTNGHIAAASNSALELATGSFVALLDHDDMLHPLALHYVADAIQAHPRCELVYTDEDKIGLDGQRQDPYFKCELNYELLLAHNMICHLGCYRTESVRRLGGFREGFEGSQDYDLALRMVEVAEPSQLVHVPRVLYHWRVSAGSTALAGEEKPYAQVAARRAVAEHLERRGIRAEVSAAPEAPAMNRVRFAVAAPEPEVTIVIPTRDRADLLAMCLDSLLERSTYRNFRVLVVDNGSTEVATAELFARVRRRGVAVRRDEAEFNFSALNNRAVASVSSEYICLMNNDIEVITPDWLEEMLGHATRPDVGAVGARLWYPDGRLQHGGVIVGIGGVAGHSHKYLPRGRAGYFGRAVLHQAMTAVTAACLLVRRQSYNQVGGLDESLRIAFNDIDFCLKLQAAGYRNVWTPYAEMVHHESASRGHETSPEKQARFNREIARMRARWGDALDRDPAYSPNLTLEHEDFGLAWPPRVEAPASKARAA